MRFKLLGVIVSLLFLSCGPAGSVQLESPDGDIQLTISNRDEELTFKAASGGATLLSESSLGVQIQDRDFAQNVSVTELSRLSMDTTWQTVIGKHPTVRNQYNQVSFRVESSGAHVYEIRVRCYNDGFAYRYHFPAGKEKDSLSVSKELTTLRFTDDFTFWAYNGEHHNVGPLRISEAPDAEIRNPMVIETSSGKYLGIHEAAIFNFAPFNMRPNSGDYALEFTNTSMKSVPPFSSSWRTFIVGDEPGDLVESDLLVNLNEPCKIDDTSWIQPGKSVWDWRVWGYEAPDGFVYGLNTESHLR